MRKNYPKRPVFSVKVGVVPTAERRGQNGGVVAEVVVGDANGKVLIRRYRAVWECPLDAYRDNKVITEPEYQAGLTFKQAYFNAVLSRKAANDRIKGETAGSNSTPSDKVLKAAYRKLSPYYMGAIIDICGHDQPANDNAKLNRLQKGLRQLVDLWKMASGVTLSRH